MKIIGIGKNYVSTQEEMPQESVVPTIFVKTPNTLLKDNADFIFPSFCEDIKFELEIALRIGKKGKNIVASEALHYVDGLTLANDMTATDTLSKSREKKGPWALAKGFDGATPIAPFKPIEDFPDIHNINFTLKIDGEVVQIGHSSLMITKPEDLIAYVSQFMTLEPGYIILTGTPAKGATIINKGDEMVGFLEGVPILNTKVV